jgi:predicted DNA-binding transcriptional regulator YafY
MPVNKSALIRYHIIDKCLTNTLKKYPSLEYIKEKIEEEIHDSISMSMFNKDIVALKNIYNAPIHYDRYHKGYCYTDADFSIKKFPLTPDEIEALDFSTALLNQLKGTSMFEQFENAINKVIEGYRINKIIGKSEKQILQVEEPVKTEANKWLEPILKAIVTKQCLIMNYQGFHKEPKEHSFSPYLLKEYRNRWYTVGYSEKAKAVLIFSLDRILGLENAKDKYFSSPDFNAEDFFKYSFGITQANDAKPETVVLSFTTYQAPYIISQPLHHSQKIKLQNDTEVQVEMELYLTHELVMTILSYGAQIKVIAPPKLKKQI